MNTLHVVDSATAAPSRRSLLRIIALESFCELLKTIRLPAYLLPTLLFPAMFFFLQARLAFQQKDKKQLRKSASSSSILKIKNSR